MASGVWAWSTTASQNATADDDINFREQQAPSTLNNSARAVMAALKKWWLDLGGTLDTSGADTAYTLTTNQGISTLTDGATVACRMHATNGTSPTLAVDGTAAKAITTAPGVAVAAGFLPAGTIQRFTYDAGDDEWRLNGAFTIPDEADLVAKTTTVTAGNGLTGGGDLSANRTLAVGAGTGIAVNADDVAVDKATAANIRAAASNKVVTSDGIESACAAVALSDASTVAVDWDAGIFFTLTVTANRQIGNPTNGQPGTTRYILVQGNNTTDRTITWGNQYLGEVPAVSDCDSGVWYLFIIFCVTSSHFVVSTKRAKG
jgi:hypothetical protein